MKKWMRVLAAALLLAAWTTAGAQPATRPTTRPASQPATRPTSAPGITAGLEKLLEMLKEGDPAFTAEQAQAMAREARPLVEKVTGRKLRKMPAIKLVSRDEMEEVLTSDLAPQVRKLMPAATDEQVEETASTTAEILTHCLMGKYGLTDKVLYLLPRNLPPLLKLGKVAPRHSGAIARLVVAHELTHALQDQEIGLTSTIERLEGLDAIQAFQATIEGHAVFVQDAVGKALGLDEAVLETSRLLAAGAVELDDPAVEMLGKVIEAQFEQIYLGGRAFMAHHHARGGHERLWEILAAPPATTAMIARPETYSPRPAAGADYAKVLEGIENDFGEGPWQVQNLQLGQMMLRSAYAHMDPAERKEILSRIKRTQALVATGTGETPKMANVTIFEFTEAGFAKKAIAAQEAMARKNLEKMRASALLKVGAATFEDFAGIRADVARKLTAAFAGPGGVATRTTALRVARGPIMLEIVSLNVPVDDKRLIAIAEKVFERLRKRE